MIHVFKRTPFYERAQQKLKINRISLFNSYLELLSLVCGSSHGAWNCANFLVAEQGFDIKSK